MAVRIAPAERAARSNKDRTRNVATQPPGGEADAHNPLGAKEQKPTFYDIGHSAPPTNRHT
ncbi:hypothetical protein [Streptomyces sp. NPDC048641]|uniref:hypothetical protein n=1 Tax=unclassified Streptomyces TaxID=2593676 RepID=UPI003440BDAB